MEERLFAIGDTHLSLGTDKPMDIFGGWNNYVERLEKNWRSVVGDGDTVLIAGDISWGMSLEAAKADFAFLDSLPGRKLLMKGNHDYWWETKHKMDGFFESNGFSSLEILFNNAYRVGNISVAGTRGWFYDAEAESVQKVLNREVCRLRASIACAKQLGGETVVFLHYPPVSLKQCCNEFVEVLEQEGIKRCYYAHLHGDSIRQAYIGEYNGINFSLISNDFLGFCPKMIANSADFTR